MVRATVASMMNMARKAINTCRDKPPQNWPNEFAQFRIITPTLAELIAQGFADMPVVEKYINWLAMDSECTKNNAPMRDVILDITRRYAMIYMFFQTDSTDARSYVNKTYEECYIGVVTNFNRICNINNAIERQEEYDKTTQPVHYS